MKSIRGLDCFYGKKESKRFGDIIRSVGVDWRLENKYGE